ncbi:MAG: hypothetical protein WA093_00320 [Minisyncoccales bacterium]
MSAPFVACMLPSSMIRDIEEEVTEWDEDGMVPMNTRLIGYGVVEIEGREVYFFATPSPVVGDDNWMCQRQCEAAPEIAEALNKMGITAHIIE